MKVLVINCGSSSLKYQLIDMEGERVLCKGLCERIGIEGSKITHKANGGEWEQEVPFHKTEYNKTDSQSDGNFDFLMNADVPEDFAKACISLICEITTTPLSTVRIGKQVLPSTQVCQALHSLTPEHLQAVYRITKYSNNVRKPKGYLLALLYNAAQAAPESNLYAQFLAMPPEEHKPSFDIKLYEKYDIFDYLNEERSPEHGT